ncbi:extracellular solute-binding protein [Leucobacter allii]|uniref:Extracellular solute-binding protein n=1 Tax=Leucobacter allii TaxID=2932247 RepID=A0ABY4FJE1_9MICO|nr:extracellular solute-binding protein [Leucobacter allii]UOQ56638.1 extracellular solute-binding protein [Leucobacter allii]UOR01072.1 extracellular solute-binding protein [Leucobacter allii]
MRMRRLIATAAITAIAGLPLVACTQAATATGSSPEGVVPELADDEQVEIVFESYNLTQAGPWTDTVEQLLAEFEEEHPNITVTAQPPQGGAVDDIVSSVQTQLLAGDPPDVAQLGFGQLDFAVNQLGAKPLNEIVGDEAVEEHFGGEHPYHPKAKVLGDWEGQTVAMPYVFSTPMLFVNRTMLEEAGVPADADLSTWDAVEEAGARVSAMTGKPSVDVACFYPSGEWCLQALILSNGGDVISEDRQTIEYGSDAAVGAVDRFAEMYESGVLRNADAQAHNEGLAKGDVAFLLQSAALQGALIQASDAGGWELDAVGLPAFDGAGESVPVNSGSALYVFSEDPAKQRAAWELISFLTSDRAFELITSQIGYLPLRPALTEEGGVLHDWAASIPMVQPNLDQLDRMEPARSFPGNSYAQITDLYVGAAEESIFYGKPASETMPAAQERAQALVP